MRFRHSGGLVHAQMLEACALTVLAGSTWEHRAKTHLLNLRANTHGRVEGIPPLSLEEDTSLCRPSCQSQRNSEELSM